MLVVLLAGCDLAPSPADWTDQLAPAGPCYEANLADGLDETSTAELHAVWACLDRQGALAGFAPVDVAFDAETREGPAGLVLARAVNDASLEGFSLADAVDDALALLEDPAPLWDRLDLGLELAYGVPRPRLVEGALPPLSDGLLPPALDLAGSLATVRLDRPEAFEPLVELLRSEALRRLAWTGALLLQSPDPVLSAAVARWPDDLAELVDATGTSGNDRWPEASGDSLRDLAVWLLVRRTEAGVTPLHALGEAAAPLLADPGAGDRLQAELLAESRAGRLADLPDTLAWLVSVDAFGDPLRGDDATALLALIRLLHDANTEVDCSIDLGWFSIDFSLGNLSVSLLEQLAAFDEDTAVSGVGLLGGLLGTSLTDDTLYAIAESGVCPTIDTQLVDDLHAVDRLADPEAEAFLRVLLAALDAFEDRVPELVDLLSATYDLGVLPPLEELLRDAGETTAAADLVVVVEALLDPAARLDLARLPAGMAPVELADAWTWAGTLLVADGDGTTPLDDLAPLTDPLLADASTWLLVDRLAALVVQSDAELRALPDGLPDALAEDPELAFATDLADRLADPDALRPAFVLLEAEGVRAALVATEPGPVPTLAEWTLDGTLQVLLDTLTVFASLLDPESP